MITAKQAGPYSVKNVKLFNGLEGQGFNCNLYRDGKKIGLCIDDAGGGPMHSIQWEPTVLGRVEQGLLDSHIKTLPAEKCYIEGKSFEIELDEGIFVSDLIHLNEREKFIRKVKRDCQTKTLFRLPNQDKSEYMTVRAEFCPKVKDAIIRRNGEGIEFFNEVLAAGEIPSVFDEDA